MDDRDGLISNPESLHEINYLQCQTERVKLNLNFTEKCVLAQCDNNQTARAIMGT